MTTRTLRQRAAALDRAMPEVKRRPNEPRSERNGKRWPWLACFEHHEEVRVFAGSVRVLHQLEAGASFDLIRERCPLLTSLLFDDGAGRELTAADRARVLDECERTVLFPIAGVLR